MVQLSYPYMTIGKTIALTICFHFCLSWPSLAFFPQYLSHISSFLAQNCYFTNRLSGLGPYPASKLLSILISSRNLQHRMPQWPARPFVWWPSISVLAQLCFPLTNCVSSILPKKHYCGVSKVGIADFSLAASLGDLQGLLCLGVPAGYNWQI